MKLRQAKKIDAKMRERAYRFDRGRPAAPRWWTLYPLDTLRAAYARLHAAWNARKVWHTDEQGRLWQSVTPEWSASSRLRSFMIRQPLVWSKVDKSGGPDACWKAGAR